MTGAFLFRGIRMIKPKRITAGIGGKSRNLDFDHMMLASAEQAYEGIGGLAVSANGIISRAVAGQVSAIMALAYGALKSAGEKISWQLFAKEIFPKMDEDWWTETVSDGLLAMFGTTEGNAETDKSEKN